MAFKYEGAGWYVTRGGDRAYVIGEIPREVVTLYTYIGLSEDGRTLTWRCGGTQFGEYETALDILHKVKEKKAVWVNAYADETFRVHGSKECADINAENDRVARIKVEYEEGQFDE